MAIGAHRLKPKPQAQSSLPELKIGMNGLGTTSPLTPNHVRITHGCGRGMRIRPNLPCIAVLIQPSFIVGRQQAQALFAEGRPRWLYPEPPQPSDRTDATPQCRRLAASIHRSYRGGSFSSDRPSQPHAPPAPAATGRKRGLIRSRSATRSTSSSSATPVSQLQNLIFGRT